MCVLVFFFQAEDGIRDLVRSRGLGDVYKRQMWQRSGVGGHLVTEAERLAKEAGRHRAIIATSNDNLPALYFYQRQQYRITSITPGSLIPRAAGRPGFAGIAVRDEIRLEKDLSLIHI